MNDPFPNPPFDVHVQLGFNPENSNPTVKKIFKHKWAWKLWCAVKQCHLTSQYFDEDVIALAKLADKRIPKTISQLEGMLVTLRDPALQKPFSRMSQIQGIQFLNGRWETKKEADLRNKIEMGGQDRDRQLLCDLITGKLEMSFEIMSGV